MALALYYAPNTRGNRPRWLLEELGVDYELVRLDLAADQHRSPEYLAIHPLGKVPALVDGDVTMFETTAICLYLADRFADAGLAPTLDDPRRAPYLQWILFVQTELEPALLDYARRAETGGEGDEARARFDRLARVVSDALGEGPYLLGEQFTTADVMLGGATGWARHFGLLEAHPRLLEYGRRVGRRDAARRARAD